MEIPERITRLDSKPGPQWTPAECKTFLDWLSGRDRLQNIWNYAALYLGKGTTVQDVEDAVVELYTIVDRARLSFRPGGIAFYYYLLHVCFKNHCLREGNRVRRRGKHEMTLECEVDEDETILVELADTSMQADADRMARNIAIAEDLNGFLRTRKLTENQRKAFVLRYLEGMSYETIAERLGSPLGSVKGWLNRATASARDYFEERGWSECHGQE